MGASIHMRILPYAFLAALSVASGASTTLVISQIYGGGGNSGATYKNDFIEILNISGSPISLNGYSVQYASAAGAFTAGNVTALPNTTLQPGHYFLIEEGPGAGGTVNLPTPDVTGNIAMSATTGKVALVNSTTAIGTSCTASVVDLIGYGTGASCSETMPAATLTNTTAALRLAGGCTDTDNNSTDFSAGAPNPRNTASPIANCSALPPPLTITTTSLPPATVNNIYSTTLAATGGSGIRTWSSTTLPATFQLNSTTGVLTGAPLVTSSTMITFTLSDTGGNQTSATLTLTVGPVPPCAPVTIGSVQGSGDASLLVGQTVTVQGIVTAIRTNGFFMQDTGDGNPATSDGIFVFTSTPPSGNAVVGNSVCTTGKVDEFDGQTELETPTFFAISSGNPLPAPHILTTTDLNPAGPIDQLEKYSGMRVTIPSLTVTGPTGGTVNEVQATSTSNGDFYGVITGTTRPFREPGIALTDTLPPGTPANVPRWDTNPEVIEIFGQGQVSNTTPLEVTVGATVTNLTGIMSFFPSMYEILPDPGSGTASGNVSFTAVPDKTSSEFTIASTNLEHFYNTYQDPNGPGSSTNVDPAAFANRVSKLSLGFRNVLKLPDIIGVEEVLDLPTLQTIASQVNSDAFAQTGVDPGYTAYLQEGNDISNINVGFLVKSTITVVDVTQYGKGVPITNPTSGSVSLLNDRPSLVLRARAAQPGSNNSVAFTVILNHLRSLDDIDDPTSGPFVRLKRKLQSEYLANLIQSRQAADPTEKIIAIGDFNAYQFNDGYVDVVGTVKGTPAPPDQVVLSSMPLVNPTLTSLVDLEQDPLQRYSYTFSGSSEEIDQFLLNTPAVSIFSRFAPARVNADFPESYRGIFTRPERISDHDWVVGYFTLPAATAPSNTDVTSSVSITSTGLSYSRVSKQFTGTLTITNTSGSALAAPLQLVLSGLPAGDSLANATGTGSAGPYITAVPTGSLAAGASVQVTIRIDAPQSPSPTFTPLVYTGTF